MAKFCRNSHHWDLKNCSLVKELDQAAQVLNLGTYLWFHFSFSLPIVYITDERVQIDWQWLLCGVHSIMMVNSAQPDAGRGCTPSPFHSTCKVVVYAPAERADTLLLFLINPFLLCTFSRALMFNDGLTWRIGNRLLTHDYNVKHGL